MAGKRRILFVAEAVTLAHVARAATLAANLDPDRNEICLACDPRYNTLLGELPYPTRGIASISGQRFFRALSRGSPIYDAATLGEYVEADRALLQDWQPDVVIGDFRLSLGISARIEGIPYLNITNAYWSPYADLRFPVPDIPLVRVAGVGLAQRLFDLARPLVFALHALPLNRVRRRYGMGPLAPDLRHGYTEADHVLYADVPELVPMRNLPANHHFLGHLAWTPHVPLPDWWNELPDDRPIVYLTLGSSGQASRLPDLLVALASLPVTVIAATAGHDLAGPLPANARVSTYLPGDQAAARAALVICNGGSPTSYQGLAAGIPVIGLAGNLDQYLNMSLIQTAGAGCLLRAASATSGDIQKAVRLGLESDAMRSNAVRLADSLRRCDPAAVFHGVLDSV
jgi:UDP:flavonoid glycosyltransferase YjiC (YdhE family)